MQTITVIMFDPDERAVFERVVTSLSVAYPTGAESRDLPEPRAVRALAGATDATHEILTRARVALQRQVDTCGRESSLDYWTTTLSATGETIKPDTPGDGLVTNPYFACQTLAQARTSQHEDAVAGLTLVDDALGRTTPRPLNPRYVDV